MKNDEIQTARASGGTDMRHQVDKNESQKVENGLEPLEEALLAAHDGYLVGSLRKMAVLITGFRAYGS